MMKWITKPIRRGHSKHNKPFLMTLLMAMGLLIGLSGCSGGGGSDNAVADNSSDEGQLVLALTDAEGDFLTYEVTVTSIKLQRQNGAIIEALPIATVIDFAQYVELSELLTIVTVPAGLYTSIELNIDYSNANVTVQDETGTAIQASLVDSDGNPLNQATVAIELSNDSRFRIAPGIPAQVTLDLDLDASNTVSFESGEAVVTVEPVLLADTLLENLKPFRLRGLLNTVSLEENVFSIDLRPFRHRQSGFGSARIHADSETSYEIDGVAYDATAGLQQLATLADSTPIVTAGEWSREQSLFTANAVYAGSSVPWSTSDALRGTVIERIDNTLTVRGAVFELSDGGSVFRDTVTVNVGADTTVTQQLQGVGNASIDDISIGSTILVTGELIDDLSMDATGGHVRIRLSNLTGSVVSVSPLSIDLQLLSARKPAIYNFAGTGTDTASDANPDNYEVNTNTLPLNTLNIGEPVKVKGLVSAFGTAPEDFIAQTVIDASDIKGHMVVSYNKTGVSTALSQVSEDGLLFDLTDATARSLIKRAGIITPLAELETMPLVIPANARGLFAITRRGRIEIFSDFGEFVTTLNTALAAGEKVTRFDAHGHFDDEQALFSAKRLRIGLTQ